MRDRERKMNQSQMRTEFQRFHRVLGRGLAVGLESNASKDELVRNPIGNDYKIEADYLLTGAHVRHPSIICGADMFNQLLLNPDTAENIEVTFKALPKEIPVVYQKINIRQRVDERVLGLAFARFPVPEISEENTVFHAIKNHGMSDGYLNLECFSRSPGWNPLFVKYHLSVVPSLRANEFGYLRMDVRREPDRNITVTVSRIRESEVPEVLKTAKTLPR